MKDYYLSISSTGTLIMNHATEDGHPSESINGVVALIKVEPDPNGLNTKVYFQEILPF